MKLSILIPTLPSRRKMLDKLLVELIRQITAAGANNVVEILTDATANKTTGDKRNNLVQLASGEYLVHFDDDDWPEDCYISEILKGCDTGADCMAINGLMTTDGKQPKRWFIAINNPYVSSRDEKGEEIYLRYPNHITPMRRELAKRVPFPNKSYGEDYDFASRLKQFGLLKTQHTIQPPIYHYKFTTTKK